MASPPPAPRLMARSMLSLGMLAARHFNSTIRKRGFIAASPPASLAAMLISLLNFANIFARLASIPPLKCFTFAHLLCPAIKSPRSSTAGESGAGAGPVQWALLDSTGGCRLDLHRRAIAQHFRYAGRQFRGVVPHPDHRVGVQL